MCSCSKRSQKNLKEKTKLNCKIFTQTLRNKNPLKQPVFITGHHIPVFYYVYIASYPEVQGTLWSSLSQA